MIESALAAGDVHIYASNEVIEMDPEPISRGRTVTNTRARTPVTQHGKILSYEW